MLTSLLPGVRELRAPLAAGAIWLVTLYLMFAPSLPENLEEISLPILRDLVTLAQNLETAVVLGFLAMLAYLVGIVNSATVNALNLLGEKVQLAVRRAARGAIRTLRNVGDTLREAARPNDPGGYSLGRVLTDLKLDLSDGRDYSSGSLMGYVVDKIVRQHGDDPHFWRSMNEGLRSRMKATDTAGVFYTLPVGGSKGTTARIVGWLIDRDYYVAGLREDLRLMPGRLVSTEAALYERWSRIDAEAEFRKDILLPIAALSGVIAYQVAVEVPGGILLSLAISISGGLLSTLLSRLSGDRFREARVQLLEGLDIGVVESQLVDEIKGGVVRLKSGGQQRSAIYRQNSSSSE